MAAKMEKTRYPGVYRRGSRYVVAYRDRGKQKWKSTQGSLAEAYALKKSLDTDVRRGEHHDGGSLTFAEYAADWLDTYTGRTTRGFRESTRSNYRRSIIDHALPFFDGMKLAEIAPQDIKRFIAELFKPVPVKQTVSAANGSASKRKTPAVSTVRNHVAAVRALFATAVEDGVLRYNPAAGVRISKPGPSIDSELAEVRRALTREELARFLATVPEEWRLFFELLAHTGVRIGEAVELRGGDVVQGARPVLKIRRQFSGKVLDEPKSRYGKRDIPLSKGLAQQLWNLRRKPDELLFATPTGSRLNPSNVRNRVLAPAAKSASVEWCGFHTFRHTTASLLFDAGRNIKVVQEWLGHHDPAFTLKTYCHLLDDGLGDAEFLDVVTAQSANRSANTTDRNSPNYATAIGA